MQTELLGANHVCMYVFSLLLIQDHVGGQPS